MIQYGRATFKLSLQIGYSRNSKILRGHFLFPLSLPYYRSIFSSPYMIFDKINSAFPRSHYLPHLLDLSSPGACSWYLEHMPFNHGLQAPTSPPSPGVLPALAHPQQKALSQISHFSLLIPGVSSSLQASQAFDFCQVRGRQGVNECLSSDSNPGRLSLTTSSLRKRGCHSSLWLSSNLSVFL